MRTSNEDTKFTRSFTAFSALAKKSCVHVHVDRALTPPSPPLFTCINLKQPTKLYGGKSRAQCGVEAFQKALSLQSCYRNHRKLHGERKHTSWEVHRDPYTSRKSWISNRPFNCFSIRMMHLPYDDFSSEPPKHLISAAERHTPTPFAEY